MNIIKEETIEDSVKVLLSDILEYDNVVNDMYESSVRRKKDEISRLKTDRVRYVNIVSDCSKKILSATKQANSTKSASALKSKMNEIERENKKKTEAEKKITEYDKKIANKEKELLREEQRLSKAKDDEYKQIERQRKMVMDNLSLDLSIQKENQNRLISEVNKLKDAKEKINILFIASNPDIEFVDDDGNTKQKQKLKLEKEAREIHESIQKSLKRDSISFQTRWATRITDLLQYINEVNPTILHFSGHGTSDGKLVFQDNNDKPKLLSMDALVELINASSDNLRLVVLNNCFSSIISEKIVDNIEASIGMNNPIGDQAAIVFASQLYSSIGFGLSLEKAFQQAIVALKLYEIPEEQTPQLYLSDGIDAKDIYLVTKE